MATHLSWKREVGYTIHFSFFTTFSPKSNFLTYPPFLALRLFSVQSVFWGTAAACEGGGGLPRGSVCSASACHHWPGGPQ